MNKKRRKESKEDVETAEGSAVPNKGVLYSVEDTPSLYLCICLGFQVSKSNFGGALFISINSY